MAPHVLAKEEIERIRSEELLRSEIRKELAPPKEEKTKREKLWEFLNSNFALWLLSAVLVSGLGTLYTNHQNRVQEANKKAEADALSNQLTKELYERLSLEISFRLSVSLSRLHEADKLNGTRAKTDSQRDIEHALGPLAFPASRAFPPLFPEFKAYSGMALIAELRRHSAGGEKQRLKEILSGTTAFIYETLGESNKVARTPRLVASRLLKKMRYSKWDNGFPYTDCTEINPFC